MLVRAVKTAFYKNSRVLPGAVIEIGNESRLPSWAEPADQPPAPVKAKPLNGDLKPPAAQKAVKAKAGGSDTDSLV